MSVSRKDKFVQIQQQVKSFENLFLYPRTYAKYNHKQIKNRLNLEITDS
jgi:hypothetical protein